MLTSLLAAALLVAAPTGPLRDIHPGPASGLRATGANGTLDWDPWLATLPDQVLFEAAAADRVTRLWASDGTAAGTQGLAAIDVDEAFAAGAQVFLLVRPDGRVHGLWRSDGTPAGTRAIAVPSIPDTTPTPLGVFAGRLLFANDYGGDGRELWISDGSDAGTALLADLDPRGSGRPGDVVDFGDRAVFTAGSASGRELWATDGSRAGTAQVADLAPGAASAFVLGGARLHRVGTAVVFPAVGGLWRSDGTPAGTARLVDLGAARVTACFAIGDRVFVLTAEPPALGASDGSAQGTRIVAHGLTHPRPIGAVGATALFFAVDGDGEALWASDGSPAGTQRLRALRSDPVRRLAAACLPSACVFAADGDGGGSEPWRSDGRTAGTRQLADLRPGPAGSQPLGFTAAAGRLVFLAVDGEHGVEAWREHRPQRDAGCP